jgi:hypothetical protein
LRRVLRQRLIPKGRVGNATDRQQDSHITYS